jgi:hypothetical protein
MTKTLNNLNLASANNYQLIIPKLPADIDIDRSFVLNIYETVIPAISFGENIISWQGFRHKAITEALNFEPWETRFIIDEQFDNWYKLYTWLTFINNNKDKAGDAIANYAIDASLLIYDNYQRPVMKIKFVSLIPLNLAGATLTHRQGETFLESSCTFVYDYFDVDK